MSRPTCVVSPIVPAAPVGLVVPVPPALLPMVPVPLVAAPVVPVPVPIVPVLSDVARLTGGRSFVLRDASGLDGALASIARELRHQYLLGYAPAGTAEAGRWHPITVRVRGQDARNLRVRARDGYVAR